ncbi:Transcription factor CarD domain protein, partial [mine drainage metagenome]
MIAADSDGSANSLLASLKREGISANLASDIHQLRNSVLVRANVPIDAGFIAKKGGLALLAEGEISGRRRPNRSEKRGQRSNKVNFDDLLIGGYVVHATHGVAKYLGMTKRSIGDSERDYLLLEYRGGDRLYVPSDQMGSITPYVGGESPSLSRLGGSDWQKTRARVKQDVQKVAQELVVLYQRRMVTKGHAYLPDSAWQ